MKLTAIKATNFHGRNFSHELADVTMIHGSEGAGKTLITDAIRIALTGYDFRLGKRPMDTFEHAEEADQMTITAAVDKRWTPALTWTREKNSISFKGQPAVATPTMLFDMSEFLKMTGEQRGRYVLSLADLKALGFDEQVIVAAVGRIMPETPAERILLAVVANEIVPDQSKTTAEWMDGLVADYDVKLKASKSSLENSTAARRGMAQAETEQTEIPSDVDVRLATATTNRENLWRERAGRETELLELNRKLNAIDAAEKAMTGYVDQSEAIAAKQVAVAALTKGIADLQFDPKRLAALEKVASKLEAEANEAATKGANALEAYEALPTNVRAENKCESCGHVESLSPKILKEKKAELAELRKAAGDAALETRQKWDASVKAFKQAQKEYDQYCAKRTMHFSLVQKENAMRSEITGLQRDNHAVEQAKATRAALGDPDTLKPPRDEVQQQIRDDTARIFEFDAEIQKLKGFEYALRDRRAADALALRHSDDIKKHSAEMAVYKAVKEAIATERDTFNEKVWASLIETANKFTVGLSDTLFGCMGGRLIFQDGRPGYLTKKGHFVSRTLSGTEEALAFAGLSVALCQNAPIKIVVIDELGIIPSRETRLALVKRMHELIQAGVIDQFVGIGPDKDFAEVGLAPETLKVIEVRA